MLHVHRDVWTLGETYQELEEGNKERQLHAVLPDEIGEPLKPLSKSFLQPLSGLVGRESLLMSLANQMLQGPKVLNRRTRGPDRPDGVLP